MVTRLRWPTFLAALLLSATACAGARPKLATQGPPPPKEGEDDFGRQRQAWIESMHRAAPGVDWRAIERENRQRSAARLMEIAATGPSSAPAKGVFWTQRGPTTQTGRTWATAIAGDGNMLLVGSGDEGGGLFSGTPGANSWTQRANLIGTGVKQLVAVPGPPETWVAVASGDSEVWVSSDRGVSWQTPNGLPNSPCGFLITRILREAGASRTVYLLATAPSCTPSATYTLLRSDDGGLDFVSMVSDNYTAAPDMWIDRVKAGPLYLLTDTGFKFSSDHGATFTTIGGLASSNPPPTNLRLAGSEAGAPTFYALVSNGTLGPPTNLWVSTDGGATWKNGGTLQDFFLSQGAVTASISNPNVVLLGGVNTARSTNGGLSFKVVNDWSEYYGDPAHKLHADLRGLDCAMYQGTETIFANTDGGTFMSTDLGATFTNMTQVGMINAEYYSTLTSKNDPNLIAAGTQDQGIQQSTPVQGGTMAFDQIIAGDYGHLTSTNGDHNMLYAAYPGFVAVLDHESPPQTVTAAQFPAARNRSWMPNLLADPADATAVYLTGDPLFRLYSSGFTWQSTAFAQNFSGGQGDYLTALAISKVDSSYWYAASALGRLWYSRDQGATWTESASQGPYAHYFYGTALLASTTSAATCYVGGSGYSGPAVYKTTDGGVTWQAMATGLPSTLVLGLAFDDPVKQNLYAVADAGPFVFDAASATWKSIVSGDAPIQGYWSVEGVPALNVVRFGTYGKGIWDYTPAGGACVAGAQALCLNQGRFQVSASWTTTTASGTAQAVQLTPDTGYLYFFDPGNVEAVIKIIDGCSLDNAFWVFAGGLTNVQTVISVRDSQTGAIKTYKNPQGAAFQPIQDTTAFATCNAGAGQPNPAVGASAAAAPDSVSGSSLLLNNDRFKVDVSWQTPDGKTGTGTPVAVTGDTGYFWFFSSSNVEMVIKVLSGCGLNSKYWVFAGGLTNVQTTITVTDTETGRQKTYTNPQGKAFQPIQDTAAFSTCP